MGPTDLSGSPNLSFSTELETREGRGPGHLFPLHGLQFSYISEKTGLRAEMPDGSCVSYTLRYASVQSNQLSDVACTCSLSERALGHGRASILVVAREVHEAAHGAWLRHVG